MNSAANVNRSRLLKMDCSLRLSGTTKKPRAVGERASGLAPPMFFNVQTMPRSSSLGSRTSPATTVAENACGKLGGCRSAVPRPMAQ